MLLIMAYFGDIIYSNIFKDRCIMNINIGDIIIMKKPHPCGSKEFEVLRTGIDYKLKCVGCGHEVMIPRIKAQKNIKSVKGISND